MLTKDPSIDSTNENINETEECTLTKAAKISHMVNEATIGAFSRQNSKVPMTKINNVQRQKSIDPWKRDTWQSVDLEMEKKRNSGNMINLMDCKAIQIKMAMKNAERMRQKQVRMEMAQRQNKLNELEEMMQNLKLNLIEKSAKKLQKNLLLREEQIVQVVQQIENNSHLAEEQAKREMEEHSKKIAEKFNRLKRVEELRGYFQSIKSLKDLFIMLFEKFVKTCISNQQLLKNFEQYTEAREGFLTRYESLIKLVNSGQLTSAEVDTLEAICDEITAMQHSLDEEIKSAEDLERTIADRKEKLQQQQQQQQQQEQVQEQQKQGEQQQALEIFLSRPPDTTDAPPPAPQIIASPAANRFVSNERLIHYQKIMKFYEEYVESVRPLQSDDGMKKFRFDCKKCVNILSNSISSVSPTHLQDKFDRLALLLSGNSVKIGATQVTPSQHPLGIRFVNLMVAKMFVKQAETVVDVQASAAFPIASLIVALWQKFPDWGNLFLAYLYKQCPFLVPYHLQQAEGQSEQDYKKSIGFIFVDNVCEDKLQFLKRLKGYVALYSSVFITKIRRAASNKPHPHGIECAWIWLTNVLNLDPLADVSPTMLHEFIVIVGAELWKVYNKQFVKILKLTHNQYMQRLNMIDTGGPKSRFESLLNKILTENKISPPEKLIPANFW